MRKDFDKILSDCCEFYNWEFIVGPDHWNNVKDIENNSSSSHGVDDTDLPFEQKKKYLILISRNPSWENNQFGGTEKVLWKGMFVFAVRSNITDPSYEFKLENHIYPLDSEIQKLIDYIPCEGWSFKKGRTVEVVDEYDTNFDGLQFEFEIYQDV